MAEFCVEEQWKIRFFIGFVQIQEHEKHSLLTHHTQAGVIEVDQLLLSDCQHLRQAMEINANERQF